MNKAKCFKFFGMFFGEGSVDRRRKILQLSRKTRVNNFGSPQAMGTNGGFPDCFFIGEVTSQELRRTLLPHDAPRPSGVSREAVWIRECCMEWEEECGKDSNSHDKLSRDISHDVSLRK